MPVQALIQPAVYVRSAKFAKETTVPVLLHASHLLEGISSVPAALIAHLKTHTMHYIRKEHYVLSILLAPKDELVKVMIF